MRILILSSSAGNGHNSAGNRIKEKFLKEWKEIVDGNVFAFTFKNKDTTTVHLHLRRKATPLYLCYYLNYGAVFSIGTPSTHVIINKENAICDFSALATYFDIDNNTAFKFRRAKRIVIYSIKA